MPRGVNAVVTTNGMQSYTLGRRESWQLLGASFVYDPYTTPHVDLIILDCRDPNGNIIYTQLCDYTDHVSRYSLVGGSEPMYGINASDFLVSFPQQSSSSSAIVTERLAPVTLLPSCTLNVYASRAHDFNPLGDPIDRVDLDTIISDLFLWVEDVGNMSRPSSDIGSFALVPGRSLEAHA